MLALVATVEVLVDSSPAAAYRTGRDVEELSTTHPVSWSGPARLELHGTLPTGLTAAALAGAIGNAVSAWSAPVCSSFEAELVGSTSAGARRDDGANIVQFVQAGWTERGFAADAAGVTDVVYERTSSGEWEIVEADVYLNADGFSWSTRPEHPTDRDLVSVLLHEIGHVGGLLHPCEPSGAAGAPDCASDPEYASSIMYPFYRGPDAARLSADDEAAICFLYPAEPCSGGCASGQTCTDDGCRVECSAELCDPATELCDSGHCVPHSATTCEREPCAIPCTSSAQCPPQTACMAGQCMETGLQPGDPCVDGESCSTGLCSSQGYCSFACHTTACPEGYLCDAGECTGLSGATLGEACADSAACLSGLCLRGASTIPVCTRACDSAALVCPSDWMCVDVDARLVCAPRASSGCSASGSHAAEQTGVLMLLLMLLAAIRNRPRSQR